MPTKKHYFIEAADGGRFAVRAKESRRATAIVDSQREALDLVKILNPNDRPDVARVRKMHVGGPDKWRIGKQR